MKRVEDARRQKNAEERLKLAAAALPPYLRPGAVNPLGVLYAQLSEGLHALEDDVCLEMAAHLQEAFEFVLGALDDHLKQAQEFKKKVSAWAPRPAKPE